MKKIFIFLITFIIITSCGKKKEVADFYNFDNIVGNVYVMRSDSKGWINATIDMNLYENDKIKTDKDSYCDIIIKEKGIFRIAQNSIVDLSILNKENKEITVKDGKVIVNIAQKLSYNETFKIQTTVGVASVRGTKFAVENKNNKTIIIVKSGKIMLRRNISLNVDNKLKNKINEILETPIDNNKQFSISEEDNKKFEQYLNQNVNNIKNLDELLNFVSNTIVNENQKYIIIKTDMSDFDREFSGLEDEKILNKLGVQIEKKTTIPEVKTNTTIKTNKEEEKTIKETKKVEQEKQVVDNEKQKEEEIKQDKRKLEENVKKIQEKTGQKGIADKKVKEEDSTEEEDEEELESLKEKVKIRKEK